MLPYSAAYPHLIPSISFVFPFITMFMAAMGTVTFHLLSCHCICVFSFSFTDIQQTEEHSWFLNMKDLKYIGILQQ
jgi:uncharacterized membrane protein